MTLLDRPLVSVTAPMGLERDLFAFKGRGFELIDPSSPGSPSQRKYGQGRADNEQLLRELKARFDRMQLQTTFLVDGDWTAMIDGRFRKTGDEFDGFKIVEVRPREVLLEVQGIRVWLKMDKQ
jgi:hypothetical protein